VPVGGSTGQVLAKTSATDYATGWSTLPDNRFLDGGTTLRIPFGSWLGQSTQGILNNGRATGFWVWLDYPWSLTNLSVIVNVAATDAGQLLRLGVYEELTPQAVTTDTNLSLVADAGTVQVDSQGTKTATLGAAVTLSAGKWFWVCAQPEVSKTNQPTLGSFLFVPSGVHGVSVSIISNNYRASNALLTHASDTSAQVAGGLASTRAFSRATTGAEQSLWASKGFISFGGTWA
jgi:hypothetical protein